MTPPQRKCAVCVRSKSLDQFDLTEYTRRCSACVRRRKWLKQHIRGLVAKLGGVQTVAGALDLAESTLRHTMAAPRTMSKRVERQLWKLSQQSC